MVIAHILGIDDACWTQCVEKQVPWTWTENASNGAAHESRITGDQRIEDRIIDLLCNELLVRRFSEENRHSGSPPPEVVEAWEWRG